MAEVMLRLRRLVAVCGCVILSGCTSLSVYVPGPLIESPEIASREKKISAGAGIEQTNNYTYTGDASRRPPNLSQPTNEQAGMPYLRAGYIATDWLEVGLRVLPGSWKTLWIGGLGGTVRAQLLGVGEEVGPRVSVYAGLLRSSAGGSGDQDGQFGPGGYNWSANASATTRTAGVSAGYRWQPNLMSFLALSYADQQLSGSITHDASQNGTSPAASYSLDEVKANSKAVAIGLRYGQSVQLALDIRAIQSSWPSYTPTSGGQKTEGVYTIGFIF